MKHARALELAVNPAVAGEHEPLMYTVRTARLLLGVSDMGAASARTRGEGERRLRWFEVLGLAGAAIVIGALLWAVWQGGLVRRWKEDAQAIPFFAAMAILPAIGVPMTPFFVVAGVTFGVGLGLLGSATALAVNVAACYWIARSALRGPTEKLVRRFGYDLPALDPQKTSALRFTLLVKLAPGLPTFAKNYVLGLAEVPFALYFVASMVTTGLYGASLIFLGESMFEHDIRLSAIAAALLAAVVLGVWTWRNRRRQGDSNVVP